VGIDGYDLMNNQKRRYITGFDGLRALAVCGVILFHLLPTKIVGGWLGVPLFFVISGYLITDILIQEYDKTATIAAVKFYIRRLKRLYPALVMMLLMTTTVILAFDQRLIYNLRQVILTNLTYVYNFWAIGHGQSYFQQFGGESPFTHLWSLSIEGQFYLVWPFVVWFILKKEYKRLNVALGLLGVSFVSALLMAILYSPANINRVYYGTDTRVFAILLGTALAFVWPSNKLSAKIEDKSRLYLNSIGTAALVILIAGMIWVNGQFTSTYYGLMYLFTVDVAILVAITAHPASWYSRLLDNKVLNYLGTRSYSIYLYQLPVFVFYEKFVSNYKPTFVNLVIEVILVLVLSELSYRYIENVIRRDGKLHQFWHWLMHSRNRFFLFITPALLLLLFVGHGLADKKAALPQPKTRLQKQLTKNQAEVAKRNKIAEKAASSSSAQSATKNAKLSEADQKIVTDYGLQANAYLAFKNMQFTAIGDSVMLDAAPYLQEVDPNMHVDAEVGRQAYQTPDIIDGMAHSGKLAPNILMGLGTNGEVKRPDLDRMMRTFGAKRQVYWMNNFVQSKPWQNSNNDMLATAQKDYKNLHVIDWFSLAKQHIDWFADDGVHQGPTGDRNYVRLLVEKTAEVNHIK
jgi:peptidoglycan/LPS O-acetylase OafA/YrhL